MGSTTSEHLIPLEQISSHLQADEPGRDTSTHRERPGGGGSSWLQRSEDLADRRFSAGIRRWEEQEEEQKPEEGTVEADARGERGGQKRIASAHCCRFGSGAALSPASLCVPACRLPATQPSTWLLPLLGPKGAVSAAHPVRRLLGFQFKGRD